ncbi:MAG: YbhB/YbcL family Raf kinase inhibitor-like protein [Gammaproteobacteria bacterium]|nr:YbhB/YbcL family Raf kinase inhibitor-like protein [Gammaproteobacteria bacterium]
MRKLISIVLVFLLVTAADAGDFTIKSSVFSDNGMLSPLYTCDGKNISPPLSWSNAPSNTVSFALVMYSPDWPEEMVDKWIIFNIPGSTTGLAEGQSTSLPDGTVMIKNSFGDAIYRGPCAPDSKPHHYVFMLYALNANLDLDDAAEIDEVMTAIKHHEIKETKITVLYKH